MKKKTGRQGDYKEIPARSPLAHFLQLLPLLVMFFHACVILSALTLPITSCRDANLDWAKLKQEIRSKFPDVKQVSTAELSGWLEGKASDQPLLLDVRERKEYEVSHLRSAILASTLKDALKALNRYAKDHPIVVYCSVGYRSSRLAEKLQKLGFKNVYNLEGSIFQWANEGRPVYAGGREVRRVHPYDRYWGQLLNRNLWAKSR